MTENNSSTLINGRKSHTYYKEIGNDTLVSRNTIKPSKLGLSITTNPYGIYAPRASKNRFAFEAVQELAAKLSTLNDHFSSDDIIKMDIAEFLQQYADNNTGDILEQRLRNHTGAIIPVSKKINTFNLDMVTKLILSYETIYQYLLYSAIEGLNVDDMEGIISNVMDGVPKVQQYLNRKIVFKVLEAKNLEYTASQLTEIQNKAATVYMDYSSNKLEDQIQQIYNRQIEAGDIIDQIETFLESGIVQIPAGMDREKLINNMLTSLQGVGYQPAPPEVIDMPATTSPEDTFTYTTNHPLFTWQAIQGSAHYEWQISKANNLDVKTGFARNDIWLEGIALGPTLLLHNALENDDYFWSVRAVSANGVKSEFSPAISFSMNAQPNTGGTPPSGNHDMTAPETIEPDDDQEVTGYPIKFMWNPVTNSLYYHLQIATSPNHNLIHGFDPDNLIHQKYIKDPAYTMEQEVLQNGKYYWSVQAIFNDGTKGNFSEVWSFNFKATQNQSNPSTKDDLQLIEGIGPRTEAFLNNHGIYTYNAIANMTAEELNELLDKGDLGIKTRNPSTWSDQARLAESGEIDKLKEWQKELDGGIDK